VVERVNFEAPKGLVDDLDKLADKRNSNRSAVIREACRKELQREAMNNE
jgi:metal-responsive CopG/Arc/MetJ family transcriptional regulator